jgi:hypothetical protein
MRKDGKGQRQKNGVSRRDFIRTSATTGTAIVAGLAGIEAAESLPKPDAGIDPTLAHPSDIQRLVSSRSPMANRREILFAIGDTLIPSAPGDPGYKDLEWYGITDEVNRRLEELSDDDLELFNKSSAGAFKKKFTELSDSQRSDYFNLLLQSGSFKNQPLQKKLQEVYSHTREVIFTVYYQNFPEDHWPRDANRVPLLRPGDEHQITNPNSSAVVTGWDLAGYAGPLTWEEEERRRNYFKKINWVDT